MDWLWIGISAILVSANCSLVGYYLTLRKQSLFGDALSHSLLPGLILTFLISGSLGGAPMLIGAIIAGLVCSFLIEGIRSQSQIKEDTSMGIIFTSMFALGVVLLTFFADKAHIDTQCILFGDLIFVPLESTTTFFSTEIPHPTIELLMTCFGLMLCCRFLHKEFVLLAFHEGMAKSMGLPVRTLHYTLMAFSSVAIVMSFKLVGAILVIGFLIIPPSFGKLFFSTFKGIYFSGLIVSIVSTVIAIPLSIQWNLNPAALIISFEFLFFCLAFCYRLFYTSNSLKKVTSNAI